MSPSDAGTSGLSSTIAARVADDLRRRILRGELKPGQRLKIDDLALLCAVSHMPIREALRELEGEGVLEVQAHRGAVIRGVDAGFVRNTYDVREAIEGMLTERCAERIDAAGIAQLDDAIAAHEAAAAKRGTPRILDANRAIHDIINAAAANPEALRVLNQGRLLIESLRLRFGYGPGRLDRVLAQHRALYRAIAKRDVKRAGQLARAHCMAARDDLLARMTQ